MRAPSFPEGLKWFNTDKPLSLEMLKGHIVLLDFWTYCCINCMHILPDLEYLEEKFKDRSFVIIGVHTPKFFNERIDKHLHSAINRYEIKHPVVSDINHEIWQNYSVKAWPTFILIGADGKIAASTSGEDKREFLEKSIIKELDRANEKNILISPKIDIKYKSQKTNNTLKFPGKIVFDEENESIFISDSNHNRIIHAKLSSNEPNRAKIKSIIGKGNKDLIDGNYRDASFYRPQGLAYHKGILYVCDTENHCIRSVDIENKYVSTIAGNGKKGYFFTSAEEGSLNSPWDCVVLKGYLYITMAGCHQIWRLNLIDNHIETFAGNGYENIIDGKLQHSSLAQPSGITSNNEALYFIDSEVSALRMCELKSEKVKTLIGSGLFDFGFTDGDFKEAYLQHPIGLCYYNRVIFIADTYNHAIRLANLNEGKIYTVIKPTDEGKCTVNGKDCNILSLYEPNDVKVYKNKLYIADTNNHLIRIYDVESGKFEDLVLE